MTSTDKDDINGKEARVTIASTPSMPYIPTQEEMLDKACRDLGLEMYEFERPGSSRLWRRVYLTRRFVLWASQDLKTCTVSDPSQPIPPAQLKAELDAFCIGKKVLTVERDFHCLRPEHHCVWELKTPDLHLFGWFIEKNWMILHSAADKNVLRFGGFAAYRPFVEDVVLCRGTFYPPLPGPIIGVKASDVVSNRTR